LNDLNLNECGLKEFKKAEKEIKFLFLNKNIKSLPENHEETKLNLHSSSRNESTFQSRIILDQRDNLDTLSINLRNSERNNHKDSCEDKKQIFEIRRVNSKLYKKVSKMLSSY